MERRSIHKIGFVFVKKGICEGINTHNYLCNAGFEEPVAPEVPGWKIYKNIPCWKGNNLIKVGKGSVYGVGNDFPSQVM